MHGALRTVRTQYTDATAPALHPNPALRPACGCALAHPHPRQGKTICINPLLPDRQHAQLITCSTPPFLPGAALHFDPLGITRPGVRVSLADNTGLEARATDPYFPTAASTSASQTALRAHCGAAWGADRGGGGPGRSTSCSSPSTSTSRLAQQPIPMHGPPTSPVLQHIQKIQRPHGIHGGKAILQLRHNQRLANQRLADHFTHPHWWKGGTASRPAIPTFLVGRVDRPNTRSARTLVAPGSDTICVRQELVWQIVGPTEPKTRLRHVAVELESLRAMPSRSSHAYLPKPSASAGHCMRVKRRGPLQARPAPPAGQRKRRCCAAPAPAPAPRPPQWSCAPRARLMTRAQIPCAKSDPNCSSNRTCARTPCLQSHLYPVKLCNTH